jgi:hypothetical protein
MNILFLPFPRSALQASFIFTLLGLATCEVIADPPPAAQIVNISSRIPSETGDAVIVSEFAVQGTTTEDVLLRAIGPSLRQFGVQGALKNPTLTLLDARGRVIDSNDDWVDSPDKQEIIDTGIAPTDDRESAIIQTLSPGIYTTVLRGVHNTTGVALSEVFVLDALDQATRIPSIGTRGEISTGDNVMISGVIFTRQYSSPAAGPEFRTVVNGRWNLRRARGSHAGTPRHKRHAHRVER